jgi:hypothetical protein
MDLGGWNRFAMEAAFSESRGIPLAANALPILTN